MPTTGEPIDILMVEDNLADVELTIEAFRDASVLNRIHVAEDGEQAMAFLRRQEPYQDAPRPDMILLDLNLPRKDGREVLVEIKNDPEFARIPVIILTTSSDERDILQAYDQHVNAYLTKPVGLDEFVRIVQTLEDFWLTVVRLPPK